MTFKDIKTKKNRGNLLTALYGNLSEDAAQMALEDFDPISIDKKIAKELDAIDSALSEIDAQVIIIDACIKHCDTVQEFVYVLFNAAYIFGANMGKGKDPIRDLIERMGGTR